MLPKTARIDMNKLIADENKATKKEIKESLVHLLHFFPEIGLENSVGVVFDKIKVASRHYPVMFGGLKDFTGKAKTVPLGDALSELEKDGLIRLGDGKIYVNFSEFSSAPNRLESESLENYKDRLEQLYSILRS